MAEPHAPSYYAATANAFPAQPQLAGSTAADVCVVGGGYTGLSAALSAAEAGYAVTLVEAHRIGWGASGRNGGQMIPGLRWSATDLVERFGQETAQRLFSVGNTARARVHDRIARHGIACDLRHGHFTAACKPADLTAMERELECLDYVMGYDAAQLVLPEQTAGIVSAKGYHGGIYDSAGGHLHPLNYALGLAEAARAAGVQLYEGSPVIHVTGGDRPTVKTAHGSVSARYVVLACDAFMGEVDADLGRYTMPVANYNIATEPLGEDRARALIPSGAAISESRFVLNYYRLSADNRLIFGGGEKYTPRPPRDVAGFVRPYMEAAFPNVKGIGIDYAWGGLVGVTMNRLPHFGRKGNIFYAHGYSGHGVLLTTLAGELITEAMRGTAERFDLFASLPVKPFPGGPLLRHPLYVAGMLWYALRDRL